MGSHALIWVVAVAAAVAGCAADLRRRRLKLTGRAGWSLSTIFDVFAFSVSSALVASTVVALALRLTSEGWDSGALQLLLGAFAGGGILFFLWQEGRRSVQLQRPAGLVFGEWLILLAALQLLAVFFAPQLNLLASFSRTLAVAIWCAALAGGGVATALVVKKFLTRDEAHRILDRIADQGEFVQGEWVPPTPECPHPERWRMLDPQSAELEVLDFLKVLVTTVKPQLILETGTFIGHSAIKMAEGLKANGFGRIVTVEYDPQLFAKARQNIDASGLNRWIENRHASSLDTVVDGPIDLLYSDSEPTIREQEVRRFLPQVKPHGLVLIHDSSSHFGEVREAALKMEREGLLSVVLLSSPRGLCIAQKKHNRS